MGYLLMHSHLHVPIHYLNAFWKTLIAVIAMVKIGENRYLPWCSHWKVYFEYLVECGISFDRKNFYLHENIFSKFACILLEVCSIRFLSAIFFLLKCSLRISNMHKLDVIHIRGCMHCAVDLIADTHYFSKSVKCLYAFYSSLSARRFYSLETKILKCVVLKMHTIYWVGGGEIGTCVQP